MTRHAASATAECATVSSARLLRFLSNPASYPHRPRSVHMVQTHASWVFFAPPFVFKLKKPVNFGFLDFSSCAKRRHFCEREVNLNRRLSTGMYLGVVPVTAQGRRLAVDGTGCPVDYLVKMRQLSPAGFLDRRIATNRVHVNDIDRIAARLAGFYQAQHPTPEIEAWGHIRKLRISTNENFRQTEPFIGHTLSHATYVTIRDWTNAFYRHHTELLRSRVAAHWIRDCHGDLHLEHVHLAGRTMNIYDCIEFNDRFRYIDVASDVAFLAMDLDHADRPDLARVFIEQMESLLGDRRLRKLVDFYKCYRAYVRGKVESLHSVTEKASIPERNASADAARRYFRLALRYVIAGSHPLVIVVMGRIASGKSTLARALGDELDWPVYSSDSIRKQLAGCPLYKRTNESGRRRLYTKRMTARTYAALVSNAKADVARGHSVILDATFARRADRDTLAKQFARHGIPWRMIELQAADSAVKQRLRARDSTARVISDARLEDFEKLTSLYEPPDELGARKCVRMRSSSSPEGTLTRALRKLARLHSEDPDPSVD